MSSTTFTATSTEDLPRIAEALLAAFKSRLVLFQGNLGAGKTTLIKALCQALGVEEEVSSPTFSVVNEYLTRDGQEVFHFDWYRLEDESEAWDLGLEDYLERGDYLFMEWPEKVSNLLPFDFDKVEIQVQEDEQHPHPHLRQIRLSHQP